jgi:hypothetical protein
MNSFVIGIQICGLNEKLWNELTRRLLKGEGFLKFWLKNSSMAASLLKNSGNKRWFYIVKKQVKHGFNKVNLMFAAILLSEG